MKIYLDHHKTRFITNEGWDGQNPCILSYFWIGDENGHCYGTINYQNLELLKRSLPRTKRKKK